ncbi:hypothetical protein GDO78_022180 [Eleutherodactylus coqui]|uniref:DNAX-activation protein 10 n=1 Tax=Eleutherodactylus coqui TaxID=57060 RepID=A0A8J6EG66_ELECQ|nr:hypothetical protein GDO78_022180 [Eleutherodactylus coqui]
MSWRVHVLFLCLTIIGCTNCFQISTGTIIGIVICDAIITLLIACMAFWIANKIQQKKYQDGCQFRGGISRGISAPGSCHRIALTNAILCRRPCEISRGKQIAASSISVRGSQNPAQKRHSPAAGSALCMPRLPGSRHMKEPGPREQVSVMLLSADAQVGSRCENSAGGLMKPHDSFALGYHKDSGSGTLHV